MLVDEELCRVLLALHLDGRDLVLEAPTLLRGCPRLLRAQRVVIALLLLLVQPVLAADCLRIVESPSPPQVVLRGTYATAFRAPGLYETSTANATAGFVTARDSTVPTQQRFCPFSAVSGGCRLTRA